MSTLAAFASGALSMGYLIAALFFLRFWNQSRDRLFAWFAASFFTLAVHRVLVLMLSTGTHVEIAYVVRLLAFVLILIAIWDKNRR